MRDAAPINAELIQRVTYELGNLGARMVSEARLWVPLGQASRSYCAPSHWA